MHILIAFSLKHKFVFHKNKGFSFISTLQLSTLVKFLTLTQYVNLPSESSFVTWANNVFCSIFSITEYCWLSAIAFRCPVSLVSFNLKHYPVLPWLFWHFWIWKECFSFGISDLFSWFSQIMHSSQNIAYVMCPP